METNGGVCAAGSAATQWLGRFLASSSGGAVIVSHDEALLQEACDRVVEVRGQQLHHYVGNYAKFLSLRAEREAQAASTASSQASSPSWHVSRVVSLDW